MGVDILYMKRNDLQPAYQAKIETSSGDAVNLAGATIRATFKNLLTGTTVFSGDNTRITVDSAAGGCISCVWSEGDTANAGRFGMEFEVEPSTGGKFTVPAKPTEKAVVIIFEDSDNG